MLYTGTHVHSKQLLQVFTEGGAPVRRRRVEIEGDCGDTERGARARSSRDALPTDPISRVN